MRCPGCSAQLEGFRHCGVELDRCASCGGVWFDAGELEAYRLAQEKLPQPYEFERSEEEEPLHCPRCDAGTLAFGRARSVRLYRCSRCSGVWLPRQPPPTNAGAEPILSVLDVVAEGLWWGPELIDLISGLFDGA
jgi:Zn-finger nucleic acid-binding protein